MHEGNGLSCKEQVRQKKEKEKKKKMQGWGDEAVCTEKRDKSRKDTGKKEEEDKRRMRKQRSFGYNAIRDHDCGRGNNKSSAQKTNLGSRERQRQRKGREKRKLNSPTRRTIRAWVSLSCNLDQTPKSNE